MGIELLIDEPLISRGREILQALERTIPYGCTVTRQYRGCDPILIMYGTGAPHRQEIMRTHVGPVVCVDLAYWDRDHAMRVSIGGQHPSVEHLNATVPAGRGYPALREEYEEEGPIIFIGTGRKTRQQLGVDASWEEQRLAQVQARYPDKQVLYRRKGKKPDGVKWKPAGEGLMGASLVVCYRSNMAVDACIAGIPVETEGGAAQWLYRHGSTPTRKQRSDFLSRLAHWQYKTSEASLVWEHLLKFL